ncbi:hypothetical protein [Sulfuriroseicoccus oceanibius]|uniref:Uncharacterized protein n=1 Tax=Sulfuriroseicoccus oceanibius TaxID=2707525 RepID=A0A6B3LFR7_9BACT|nr:hypothetical protein [Sulfuriroseicoccus oceanibius]QQL44077.1 hypothetical protein G3M56_009240 [Sulfuriroseicoccus oceanibius]
MAMELQLHNKSAQPTAITLDVVRKICRLSSLPGAVVWPFTFCTRMNKHIKIVSCGWLILPSLYLVLWFKHQLDVGFDRYLGWNENSGSLFWSGLLGFAAFAASSGSSLGLKGLGIAAMTVLSLLIFEASSSSLSAAILRSPIGLSIYILLLVFCLYSIIAIRFALRKKAEQVGAANRDKAGDCSQDL